MRYTNKQIWHITYPILVAVLMEHMINLTDTAFLGRVGEIELGASALAGVYYMAIFMLGFGFSVGAQILMARRNGEGNHAAIGPVFWQGTTFLLLLAAVIFAVSQAFTPRVLERMIESPEVCAATNDYLRWRVYGFFFSFVAVMFRAFLVATTQTKILTLNSLVMVGTNVVLNYALIFGKLGMPELGIAGAAIASSVSEGVSVLFFALYIRRKVDWRKYALGFRPGLSRETLGGILNVSVWTMVQYFLSSATWFLFFIAVEHLGERPLAVSNIVRSVSTFFFMPITAFAAANSSLVSNLIGAGEQEHVMGTCRQTIRLGYCFLVPLLALALLFPSVVLRIYTDDLPLVEAAVPSLYVMLSSLLLSCPGNILFSAVSGTGDTRRAFFMEICTLAFYMLYMVCVAMVARADVAVCWTTEHAYWGVLLLFAVTYLRRGTWRGRKI